MCVDLSGANAKQPLSIHNSKFNIHTGGTGSGPPGCHGPQRRMRFTASHEPLMDPCRSIASLAYSEQVG